MRKLATILIFCFHFAFLYSQGKLKNYYPVKWSFRELGKEQWHDAEVPGTVHTDLLKNNLIPDPFFGSNEILVKEIENKTWEYIGRIHLNTSLIKEFENIELVCEGLDTYAEVYFNDTLLFRSDNMFVTWRKDVKKLVRQNDSNYIRIIFFPATLLAKKALKQIPFALPGDERVFTRKAQYHYGWDWGPQFVTAGIWKPLYLQLWNNARFGAVKVKQIKVDSSEVIASLNAEILCTKPGNYQLNLNAGWASSDIHKTVSLKSGLNETSIPIQIKNPKLWWCNGLGDPNLYKVNIALSNSQTTVDEKSFSTGFRKVELVRERDTKGEGFYFKLNGRSVFVKGANYIPHDNFLSRASNYNVPEEAANMNMNMLRIWGGGAYADDKFYSDCDRNGVLVWQDFMFACAMYPGDSSFVKSVREEAKQQVQRISNHPCLALWCGNNENDEGWHNWGWQKEFKYSKKDSAKIWNDYLHLFHKVLPSVINEFDPETAYWPSSPSIGWGRKESLLQGDSHYWGVWWGNEPFEVYEKKVGRFMSEYGFQGMPALNTFKQICDSAELNLNSPSVKNHQKHPAGYKTIQTYLDRDFKTPKSFKQYIYVSQLLQSMGMRTAIEAHRRAKPYCMGTLYWQMNDCWPVTSWSAIDYYGRKKALYFETKRTYSDLIISIDKKEKQYDIVVVSDQIKTTHGTLFISVKDFSGKILFLKTIPIKITSDSARIHFSLHENEIKTFTKNQIYLNCKLSLGEKILAAKNYYFVSPKDLNLPKPGLKVEWNGKNSIAVSAQNLIKDLYLFWPNKDLNLEDNFLDLEPGEKKVINVIGPVNNYDTIKFLSLYDINKAD